MTDSREESQLLLLLRGRRSRRTRTGGCSRRVYLWSKQKMRARGVGRCGKGRWTKGGRAAAVHCLSSKPQQNIVPREPERRPFPPRNRALTVADESISWEYLHLYELAAFSRPHLYDRRTQPPTYGLGRCFNLVQPTLLRVSLASLTGSIFSFLVSRFSLSASGAHSSLIVSIFPTL